MCIMLSRMLWLKWLTALESVGTCFVSIALALFKQRGWSLDAHGTSGNNEVSNRQRTERAAETTTNGPVRTCAAFIEPDDLQYFAAEGLSAKQLGAH